MRQSALPQQAEAGDGREVPGSVVILGVVGLSVAAATFSWFYYRRLQERPLALWGSEAASLILRAPVARAYRLTPDAATADAKPESAQAGADSDAPAERAAEHAAAPRQFIIGGAPYVGHDERDISHAPGFSHVRQGLIHDRSFAWDDAPGDATPLWEYAVEFDDTRSPPTVVAFDFGGEYAVRVGGDRRVSIRPVAAAIKAFLAEQFPAAEPHPPAAASE